MTETSQRRLGDVAVLGLGRTGESVARFFLAQMPERVSSVTVFGGSASAPSEKTQALEEAGATVVCGTDEVLGSFDLAVASPGIPEDSDFFASARAHAAEVIGEPELAWRESPERWVAITGTNGKTTTTSLATHLLQASGLAAESVGNIGTPPTEAIASREDDTWFVAELSSFQLHSINIRPDVAVVTNVSPNHLDKHPTYEDYVDAKRRIFANQQPDDLLIVNRDNAVTARFGEEARSRVLQFSHRETVKDGVFCRDGMLYCSHGYEVEAIIPETEILLPGEHNVENYMAAFAAVDGLVSPDMCRAVARSYGGVRHRLELIRKLDGVSYINDSIATSPTRTIAGLRAMRTKPVLIAGGHDKHVSFDSLADEIAERVKALYLTGDTAEQIAAAVRRSVFFDPSRLPIYMVSDLRTAVCEARERSVPGDVILLSPACSSFDRFKNFAERGDTFRKIVMEFEGNET